MTELGPSDGGIKGAMNSRLGEEAIEPCPAAQRGEALLHGELLCFKGSLP